MLERAARPNESLVSTRRELRRHPELGFQEHRTAQSERHHHHRPFDIDERCLPIGAALLAEIALRFLWQSEVP